LQSWERVVKRLREPTYRVRIGVVGKYIELQDSYKSVYESITHGGIANDTGIEFVRIDSEALERDGLEALEAIDGIVLPGGFGSRGTEGMIMAAKYAREQGLPYFGLCLGLQIAVIEFSRHAAQLAGASSEEFSEDTAHPVIHIMEDQKEILHKGASMRLGAWPCKLLPGTRAHEAYSEHGGEANPSVPAARHEDDGSMIISERHRHRYEFNNSYRERLEAAGLTFSGVNPERDLIEIVEITEHPWFLAVQFHPEFQSKPDAAHPLFASFVAASLKRHQQNRS
ncbi:MAG: CTP synthase, partial [Verrucomicrobiota bacterium]